MSPCRLEKQLNWGNITVFGLLALITAVGLPWYALTHGISTGEWVLFLFFSLATGLSVTVSYHRLFAHKSFQAHPAITFLSLVFGAAAFEQSAIRWASQHRDHHRYVDTEHDPYNIKNGFWYAHIGWLLFYKIHTNYDNVKDLSRNRWIALQDKYYVYWAVGTGVVLPVAIGALMGHALGAFILSVAARLTLIHHTTFSINSVCHTFGRATYDIDSTAKDHWLVALLTNGEGYHNFHHKFASDYRNGVRWYHWDPSKWIIASLSWAGLAERLHRTSPQQILAARASAAHLRVERSLKLQSGTQVAQLLDKAHERYTALKEALQELDRLETEYRALKVKMGTRSKAYLQSIKEEIELHRKKVSAARNAWIDLVDRNPLLPKTALI